MCLVVEGWRPQCPCRLLGHRRPGEVQLHAQVDLPRRLLGLRRPGEVQLHAQVDLPRRLLGHHRPGEVQLHAQVDLPRRLLGPPPARRGSTIVAVCTPGEGTLHELVLFIHQVRSHIGVQTLLVHQIDGPLHVEVLIVHHVRLHYIYRCYLYTRGGNTRSTGTICTPREATLHEHVLFVHQVKGTLHVQILFIHLVRLHYMSRYYLYTRGGYTPCSKQFTGTYCLYTRGGYTPCSKQCTGTYYLYTRGGYTPCSKQCTGTYYLYTR